MVETKNFKEKTGLYGGDENLHLTERFTKLDNGNLLYNFTVDDPTAWTKPWSGEYVWKSSTDKVYEYACHGVTTLWGIFCVVHDYWSARPGLLKPKTEQLRRY